jgi:pectate lyase
LWSQWSGASKVYFQSSVAGDARAAIGAPADDQVVRVRARLDTFATAIGAQERWFGVMARQSDARNYYYLTLRSSNQLSLRKFVDGAATVLASTAFTVAPGTWYDLRLEVVGSELRAYVNGTLRLEATDTTHTHGRSGPVMFKTAADYDDFIAYQP